MQLAKRRFSIESSGIRKVFSLAANMKDPINLSIGQPDFDVPGVVKDACINAIKEGKNRYTLTGGIPPLRQAVLKKYQDKGIGVEDVMIASGTSGALVLLLNALLDPGDEALVPDPYFVMYKHLTNLVGAKPVYVDTYPDFRLTRERLEAAYTPRCKMLILNTPANPTGIVYTEEECRIAAEFAEEKDLWVISDEIYEEYCFDGPFATPSKYLKKPIVISGLSKSVAMTGWRLGWVAAPKEVIDAVSDLQQYTFVCAPSMVQEAALVALEHDMAATRDQYRQRRDTIYNGLIDAGFAVEKPGGAFYIFPEAPGGDGAKFVEAAIKNNVLIIPGNVFSEKNSHFRICFTVTEDKLKAGLEVLGNLAGDFAAAK